jgi:hypothetical protein
LSDPDYQLHVKRMRLGGWLIGGSTLLLGGGTTLVVFGAKKDHPQPLCTSFHWTGPLLTCDGYESEAEFDARLREAQILKGTGIVTLFMGAAMLGTGLGVYLVNRRGRERRMHEIFGPLQGLRVGPSSIGRGAQLSWQMSF